MKKILEGNYKSGFTLIELLVVTAILGVLIGVSTSVFIGILRSQNKTNVTNEVRQNATLAIDLFERDVRGAASITPTGSTNSIDVQTTTETIRWTCKPEITGIENGWISRQVILPVPAGDVEVLTNQDTTNGVSIDCTTNPAFNVSSSTQPIVTFRFSAGQGIDAPGRSDFNIDIPFETTVGIRGFN